MVHMDQDLYQIVWDTIFMRSKVYGKYQELYHCKALRKKVRIPIPKSKKSIHYLNLLKVSG